jgi:hypothetical protein
MLMRVCYVDCREAGLCCYLVIQIENYYVHNICVTSICDLFTDSPSYMLLGNLHSQNFSCSRTYPHDELIITCVPSATPLALRNLYLFRRQLHLWRVQRKRT